MTGEGDRKDKNESRRIAIALIATLIILGIGAALIIPDMTQGFATAFSPGLGLKEAAVIAFFITVAVLIVFAVVSGDGLLGELQFMIAGFLVFFLIFWLMIAWIF